MDKSGKWWGQTSTVFARNDVEVHYIEILPGGFCSEHRHKHKYNQFIVLEGHLTVVTWKAGDTNPPDEVTLGPGDETVVKPTHFHKFVNRSQEPVKALEIYFVVLDSQDIERRTHGGRVHRTSV